ncbi:hypothetical protein QTO34_012988 [Cnephaeus nilssonii]|uniref:Uncharacterized protein n=1 Tax=Cnephaeus nilssonii TaxID=3371016 RepID=A0AA40HB51_CNENI|nr:hypothetical protein QTO34_012988 [Eptesicus nilssonii]
MSSAPGAAGLLSKGLQFCKPGLQFAAQEALPSGSCSLGGGGSIAQPEAGLMADERSSGGESLSCLLSSAKDATASWRSHPQCIPGKTEKLPACGPGTAPAVGYSLVDREAAHPTVLGTSTCSWLQPGRWRSHPPRSTRHQYLQLAVARETEKPPTPPSWAPALAAAPQAKPPARHPLRLQPAWAPMADQREGSLDPGCLWMAGRGNPGSRIWGQGRERKGEGERVRNIDERGTSISRLLHTPYWGCARNQEHKQQQQQQHSSSSSLLAMQNGRPHPRLPKAEPEIKVSQVLYMNINI